MKEIFPLKFSNCYSNFIYTNDLTKSQEYALELQISQLIRNKE